MLAGASRARLGLDLLEHSPQDVVRPGAFDGSVADDDGRDGRDSEPSGDRLELDDAIGLAMLVEGRSHVRGVETDRCADVDENVDIAKIATVDEVGAEQPDPHGVEGAVLTRVFGGLVGAP